MFLMSIFGCIRISVKKTKHFVLCVKNDDSDYSGAGMGLRHRQLAHGELKIAWVNWVPCTTRPGGPRMCTPSFVELGVSI